MRHALTRIAALVSLSLCALALVFWAASYHSSHLTLTATVSSTSYQLSCLRGILTIKVMPVDYLRFEDPSNEIFVGIWFRLEPLWFRSASGMDQMQAWGLSVQCALLALTAAIVPAWRKLGTRSKRRRRFRRERAHLCTVCGYDLRSTPNRCPECGAFPPVIDAEDLENGNAT